MRLNPTPIGGIMRFLLILLCLSSLSYAGEVSTDADRKQEVALSIARLYQLSRPQAILLLAIRDHEAGGPGKEFGCEYKPCPFKDGKRSYVDNCARCCEIIKQRCPVVNYKSVKVLNKTYAADPDWHKGVWREMRKYKNILY